MGSDYLAWGANHQKLTLEFEDGTTGEVVVRATGRLRGLGDVPAFVLQTVGDRAASDRE